MHARSLLVVTTVLGACAEQAAAPPDELRVDQVEVTVDGSPFFARGALGFVGQITDTDGATRAFAQVLPELEATLRLPADSLAARRVDRDRFGMAHVRFEQRLAGLRVIGGDVVAHVGAEGVIRSVTSSAQHGSPVSATPRISAAEAAALAAAATPGTVEVKRTALVYEVSSKDGALRLTWEVAVVGTDQLLVDLVYVDAHAGREVDRHPQVFTARNRTIKDGDGQIFLLGAAFGQQVGTETSPPSDAIARAAFDNTGATYDCFKELYDRDSWDGAGGALMSTVHIVYPSPSGGPNSGNNASWFPGLDGLPLEPQMMYGDGDGVLMAPLARAFDVTAHELTHGVTSATANLVYMDESGALNEGLSDIMSAACDVWKNGAVTEGTFLIGEEIWTPNTPGDALRYMANPTIDEQSADFYPERYMGSEDNGGVHLNSGIANLAFYLLAQGGTHPRGKTTFEVPAIGVEQAGQIFQAALTKGYFTMNTNFAQARTATEQVARELFPEAFIAVGTAWAAVGIGVVPEPDLVPPTVNITSPSDGAAVPVGFAVSVDAGDDKGVLRVELQIDGVAIASATTAPYNFSAPAGLAPGKHTVSATATDGFNKVTDSITVEIDKDCVGTECGIPAAGEGEDEVGGCCSAGQRRGLPGTFVLLLGTALLLGRRRRR
jgi:Zn-dependent metalloprotease